MASEDRTTTSDVTPRLEQETELFDFFQALRLFELTRGEGYRLGKAKRGGDEPIRISQAPHVIFPTSSLVSFDRRGDFARLEVLLIGLFGPQGPLPLHLTTHAMERRDHHADRSFLDFCNMLQHRLLSLFYRAWADARPHTAEDRFRSYLAAQCGLGLPSQQNRTLLDDNFKLRHAGLLAQQARHPGALATMLKSLLGPNFPLHIEEFVGGWLALPVTVQTRLGQSRTTGVLGQSVVVGRVTWQCQHRFRIHVGPLSYKNFCRLLPGEPLTQQVSELVHTVIGFEFDWDMRLILRHDDIPPTRPDGWQRLGLTSWLAQDQRTEDAADLTVAGIAPGTPAPTSYESVTP